MLVKSITYTDYNGTERTEKFLFNISEAELADLETSREGGLRQRLTTIVDAKDQNDIIHEFKRIILFAYGKKSDDGRRFMKSPEISKEFEECPAYSKLFMELSRDSQKALDFINAVLPNTMPAEAPTAPNISVTQN